MAEEGNLPIEELGIDLVVNTSDSFVGDMKKAGTQMDTFSGQIKTLADSLPALNVGLTNLTTHLSNINNRVNNVSKLANALTALSKLPDNIGAIATKSKGAVTELGHLTDALVKMKTAYSDAGKLQKGFNTKGAIADLNAAAKALEAAKGVGGAGAKAAKEETKAKKAATATAKTAATTAVKTAAQQPAFRPSARATDVAQRIVKSPRNANIVEALKVDLKKGKIGADLGRELKESLDEAAASIGSGSPKTQAAVKELGAMVGEGMTVGLKDAETAVAAGAASLAQQVLVAMKHELGIASASKRTRKEVGQEAGAGVEKGVEDKIPDVEAAARKMGEAAVNAAAEGAASASKKGGVGKAVSSAALGEARSALFGKKQQVGDPHAWMKEQLPPAAAEQAGERIVEQATAAVNKGITQAAAGGGASKQDAAAERKLQESLASAKRAGELDAQRQALHGQPVDADYSGVNKTNKTLAAATAAAAAKPQADLAAAEQRTAQAGTAAEKALTGLNTTMDYMAKISAQNAADFDTVSALRGTVKTKNNRGLNLADMSAAGNELDMIAKLAGVYGSIPGTESIGSSKSRRVLVRGKSDKSGRNAFARSVEPRGGISMGHNVGKRDFTGDIFQEGIKAFNDAGGVDAIMERAVPGTKEWDTILKHFSTVTTQFPWDQQEPKVPKNFKGDVVKLKAAMETALQEIVVKQMGLDAKDPAAIARVLATKEGAGAFNAAYDNTPAMAPHSTISPNVVRPYLARTMYARQRVDEYKFGRGEPGSDSYQAGAGDPQITGRTSEMYDAVKKAVIRSKTVAEAVKNLNDLNDAASADLMEAYKQTQNPIFRALANREGGDPVIRQVSDYLQKFGDRQSVNMPGKTVMEALSTYGEAWERLKEDFKTDAGVIGALSEYEEKRRQALMPTTRRDAVPAHTGSTVRRGQGARTDARKYAAQGALDRGLAAARAQAGPLPVGGFDPAADLEARRTSRQVGAPEFNSRANDRATKRTAEQIAASYDKMVEFNLKEFATGSQVNITETMKRKLQEMVPDPAALSTDKRSQVELIVPLVGALEGDMKALSDETRDALAAYMKKTGKTLTEARASLVKARGDMAKAARGEKAPKVGKDRQHLVRVADAFAALRAERDALLGQLAEIATVSQRESGRKTNRSLRTGEARARGQKYAPGSAAARFGIDPRLGANVERNLPVDPDVIHKAPGYADTFERNQIVSQYPGLEMDATGKRLAAFYAGRTKRRYQEELLGSTAEAIHGPTKPLPIRQPMSAEMQDKVRLYQAKAPLRLQQSLANMKAPLNVGAQGGALEGQGQQFNVYTKQLQHLLGLKSEESFTSIKTAFESINTGVNNYVKNAVQWVDSFAKSGIIDEGAVQQFAKSMGEATSQLSAIEADLKAGKKVKPEQLQAVAKGVAERVDTMRRFISNKTTGLAAAEDAANKLAAEQAAQQAAAAAAAKAAQTPIAARPHAAGGRAAAAVSGAAGAVVGAAQQTVGPMLLDIVNIVNAVGRAADRIVAAIQAIKFEFVGGGIATNTAGAAGSKKPKKTAEQNASELSRVKEDLLRTSEVDAYRASHTAMRQVRQANDLDPELIKQRQIAIDAWRESTIKAAAASIMAESERGGVVDAFRASRSQSDLNLQKLVGPEIRKTISNQETAVSEREMRTLKTAFNDIARAERDTTTALQKSGAPAAVLQQEMKAISLAAEQAREDVIAFSQSAESFQILDAKIDQVVGGLREMGAASKYAADQIDRTPLMQRQLAIRTRGDSITRDAERAKFAAGKIQDPTKRADVVSGIDAAAKAARHDLAVMLNEARKGGVGAESSMAAFNLELQKVRSNASANIDALKRQTQAQVAAERAAEQANNKAAAAAKAASAATAKNNYYTERFITGSQNRFTSAERKVQSLGQNPLVSDKNAVAEIAKHIAEVKAETQQAIDDALNKGLTGQDQTRAVVDAINSTRSELDGLNTDMKKIEKTANTIVGNFQKIDHAARDMSARLADISANAKTKLGDKFEDSLTGNFRRVRAQGGKKVDTAVSGLEGQISAMYTRARAAAAAGDQAAVNQLVWEIRKLTDAAEKTVDDAMKRILARAEKVDKQVERIKQANKYAQDPQQFLQDKLETNAKKGGVGGFISRFRLGRQEGAANNAMFASVMKERAKMPDPVKSVKPMADAIRGVGYTFKWLFNIVTAPVAVPALAAFMVFKKASNGIIGAIQAVGNAFKWLRGTTDEQQRNKKMAQDYYDKNISKSKIKGPQFDMPSFSGVGLDNIGSAATKATSPIRKLLDTLTFGLTKAKKSAGPLAQDIGALGTAAAAKPKTNKLFADMGTGVGLGFGASFAFGVVNSIQNAAHTIQRTISNVITTGFGAVMETEMRKMTIRSFSAMEMTDTAMEKTGKANFGQIWEDAGVEAEKYYQQIVNIAKVSSYSRKPLLDLFNNMQVGGLNNENAASVTRAATMFGDAFMPGQKQMIETFGTQVMQMLSQGVMQQVDLKLLAQQGIPVYKFLSENIESLKGKSQKDAQSEIFDLIGKGQLGAVEGLEAIVKGMVDAAENFKGKAATTFSGLMSTFGDLMLEKSEAVMGPVAENLFKPFIEFGNDFLQSDAVTKWIEGFGKQINVLSKLITDNLAFALGVIYGLWSNLPDPIKATVAALAEAVAIMGTLSLTVGALAVVGALLAPVFAAISGGVIAATAAIGVFVAAYTNNLFGFQTFLNGFAQSTLDFFMTWGSRLAQGILDGVGQAATAAANVLNDFGSNFMANLETIYGALYNFGQHASEAIGSGFGQIGAWVNVAIEYLWALPQNIDDIVGWMGQAWNDMVLGLTTFAQSVWETVQQVVTAFWAIPENLDQVGASMAEWGANVVEMFAQGMQGAIDVVFEALSAIGDMFTEWLEPGSPPKLLPDLTTWGTGAADAYLEGWTKADFGVMNDLASKLEEALALDEGALKEFEIEGIREGVARMVGKAVQGFTDIGDVMNAIPGWGGRAEQVSRLATAYGNLAVSQHKLTVEQEKLDAVTAKYDAILKPLEARLNSIRNKQEALDLTDQIEEYQRVLNNVYATDKQKEAAKLKMEELKLSEQINNVEMERDRITDPINERISALTEENNLNQDALDLAVERWNVELGMLKAQPKEKGAGADSEKDPKAKKEPLEKNRQFEQPKLNVPAFSGTKSLGAIGSKMKQLADKISGYFKDMGDKVKPFTDALQSIIDKAALVDKAIQDGMLSRTYTTEGGFIGFLNNVGVAIADVQGKIDGAMQSWNNFTGAIGAAWQFGDPNAGVLPGPKEKGVGPNPTGPLSLSSLEGKRPLPSSADVWKNITPLGGVKPSLKGGGFITDIAQQWDAQAGIAQRAKEVSATVQSNLSTTLTEASKVIAQFMTDISEAVSKVDWATVITTMKTNLTAVTKTITDFVTGIPAAIATAFGVDPKADPLKQDKQLSNTFELSGEAVGKIIGQFLSVLTGAMAEIDWKTGTEVAVESIPVIAEKFLAWLSGAMKGIDWADLAKDVGLVLGQVIAGAILGAVKGAAYIAIKLPDIAAMAGEAATAIVDAIMSVLWNAIIGALGSTGPDKQAQDAAAAIAQGAGTGPKLIPGSQPAVKPMASLATGVKPNMIPGTKISQQTPIMDMLGATDTLGALTGAIGGAWNSMFGSFQIQTDTAVSMAAKAFADFGLALPGDLAAIIEAEAPNGADKTMTTYSEALIAWAGSDKAKQQQALLATGIWGGLDSAMVAQLSATGASSGVFKSPQALVDYFALAFDIHSPSKVFQDQIGVPIGQGILAGINQALSGGVEGGGPQAATDTVFAGILASMTAFNLSMQVSWLNLKTAVTETLNTLSEEWLGVFDTTIEDANEKFDTFATDWIEERVPAFGEALIELANQFKEGFLEKMQEAVDGMTEKLQAMIDMVSSEDIRAAFHDAGVNLATALVDGIIEGMTSDDASGRFESMADAVIGEILAQLKNAAGSNSPSKVMRDEVGLSLAQGIGLGMTYPVAQRHLEDSSSNVIEQIVRNFQTANAPQATARTFLAQPEQNVVSMNGVGREYHMHLNVTPQMAERVEYNFAILESMAG